MKTVCGSWAALVRHGAYEQPPRVPSALLPHPLTPEGREHARCAARDLAELAHAEGWTLDPVIDTSRQLRAWETGTLIAEALSARLDTCFRVEEFEALSERKLGCVANLTVEAIEQIVARDPRITSPLPDRWKSRGAFKLPLQGTESLLEAGVRVARHLQARTPLPSDGARLKVFVGHGGAFRFAAVELGLFTPEGAEAHSMFHGKPVVLRRSDADTWTHTHGEWKQRPSKLATSTVEGMD